MRYCHANCDVVLQLLNLKTRLLTFTNTRGKVTCFCQCRRSLELDERRGESIYVIMYISAACQCPMATICKRKKANLTTFTITDMHTYTYCCHSSMGEEQKICHNIILSNPWGKRLDLICRDLANLLSSSFSAFGQMFASYT